MRRIFKGVVYTTVTGGALTGYAMYTTRQSPDALPKWTGPELSAEEWNAAQDTAAVDRSFASLAELRSSSPALYWLYGCPYCARVRAIFDHVDVPYTPIAVDPVNFEQLNPMPYKCCPQVQLLDPRPDKASYKMNDTYGITVRGPMVADSEVIIQRIAKAAKVDLSVPRVAARREWITNDVSRLVFVAGGSTFSRAYGVMPLVTPDKYHGVLFRLGGAIPMFLLANYKTSKRIADYYQGAGDKVPAEVREVLGDKPFTIDKVDAVLAAELRSFLKEAAPFHGGAKPNFVDVELYGLLRSQEGHAPIRAAIKESGAQAWYQGMQRECRTRALGEGALGGL